MGVVSGTLELESFIFLTKSGVEGSGLVVDQSGVIIPIYLPTYLPTYLRQS